MDSEYNEHRELLLTLAACTWAAFLVFCAMLVTP